MSIQPLLLLFFTLHSLFLIPSHLPQAITKNATQLRPHAKIAEPAGLAIPFTDTRFADLVSSNELVTATSRPSTDHEINNAAQLTAPLFAYDAAQEFPDVDANRVVWQDARAGATDIYLWSPDLTSSDSAGEVRNLTNSSDWEVQPAIERDWVVWKDGYEGIGIHGLNLQSGALFTVTTGQADLSRPRLSGGTVVWAADGGDGDWNIYGYEIATNHQIIIENGVGNQVDPQIDWPYVVWWDDQEHIYLHHLETGKTTSLLTTQGARLPAVSALDQLVVWQDKRNGNWDLYGFDLLLNREVPLVVAPDDQEAAVLTNGLLAYQSRTDSGPWNIGLWIRVLDQAFLVDRHPGYQTQPALNGTTLVWQDSRSHQLNIYRYEWLNSIPSAPIPAVAAPANLQVGGEPNAELLLQWEDRSENEDGFTIERATGITGTTWQSLTELPANSSLYTDATAQVGQSYWYRVQAFRQNEHSFYSNESFGTAFGQSPTTDELYLMTLINAARADPAAYGYPTEEPVPPLVYNPLLAYTAHSHSQAILNSAFQFGHCDLIGRCPTDRVRALGYPFNCTENLVTTTTTGPLAMIEANAGFLASNGHRRSMLAADLTEFGVGHTFDTTKGDAQRHGQVTELFCGAGAVPIPSLPDGIMVPPTSGDPDFTFLANFYSATGKAPLVTTVIIDGATYPMTLLSGVAAHGTYTLKLSLDARVKHNYIFYFRDGDGNDLYWAPPGARLLGDRTIYLPVVSKR